MGLSWILDCASSDFLGFFGFFDFVGEGRGLPRAFARSAFLSWRSSSGVTGGGVRDVMDAEMMVESVSVEGEDSQRSMFWWSFEEKVMREVMVDEPLGRRMRRRGEDVGEVEVDWREEVEGGVQEERW